MIGNIDLVLKNNPQYHGMEDSDTDELIRALGHVAKARGMTKLPVRQG